MYCMYMYTYGVKFMAREQSLSLTQHSPHFHFREALLDFKSLNAGTELLSYFIFILEATQRCKIFLLLFKESPHRIMWNGKLRRHHF